MPFAPGCAPTAISGRPLPHRRDQRRRLQRALNAEALRLVAVTDEPTHASDEWLDRVAAAVRGGATSVQVRAKKLDSRALLELVRRLVASLPVPVLVNDRADVALMAGAAGVHVGPDDMPVEMVRELAPPSFIVGASLGSRAELETARGADYVGIGPAFVSSSKPDAGRPLTPDEINNLQLLAAVPAVAIGGITPATAREILAACPALAGVASVSAMFGARDVAAAAQALRAAIGR